MKICLIILFAIATLSGCFYGHVELTAIDKKFIPYHSNNNVIVFKNHNTTDSLLLERKNVKTKNVDFFIDKRLGRHNYSKKTYFEVYATSIRLNEKQKKICTSSLIKYNPFIFTFYKNETDSLIKLRYFIDGRWKGEINFKSVKTDTIEISKVVYSDIIMLCNDSLELFDIDKMYWSVKNGLVRIDEKNGNIWELITVANKSYTQ